MAVVAGFWRVCAVSVAMMGLSGIAQAAPYEPYELDRTLEAPFGKVGDTFGASVAIQGDLLLIGAPSSQQNFNRRDPGRAYLISASTGKLLQTFNDPTPTRIDFFGTSVSISGDNVLIGADGDDSNGTSIGQAHLFSASTGKLLRTFDDPTPTSVDRFGRSVSISGDNVLIGASNHGRAGAGLDGEAHLFSASTGRLLHTFKDPTPTAPGASSGFGDDFGRSVSVSGDKVLISAPRDNSTGLSAGAGQALLFSAKTGDLLHTFNDPTPNAGGRFGTSIVVSGDNVLISSLEESTNKNRGGEVHLFSASTGELLQSFFDPTPLASGRPGSFGHSVSISGDKVLVGELWTDGSPPFDGTSFGQVHLFSATTGELLQSFNGSDPMARDQFGDTVFIDGNNIVIGASRDGKNGPNTGRAYLFSIEDDTVVPSVPEPATWALLGIGIFGLGVVRRRRRG